VTLFRELPAVGPTALHAGQRSKEAGAVEEVDMSELHAEKRNGPVSRPATGRAATAPAARGSAGDAAAPRHGPERVVPTTKVNVAFPFSQIKIQEPTPELAALATLVAELARLLAEAAPGPKAQALQHRAGDLASKLA
jgi:hypothetical protein